VRAPVADSADRACNSVPLLSVRDLSVSFGAGASRILAVDDFGLDLHAGEVIGVIGESGSGKTTAVRALIGLLPTAAKVTSGTIDFAGQRVFGHGPNRLQSIRGDGIGMVFQSASASINPLFTIGYQLREIWRAHRDWHASANGELAELLRRLGLKDAERVMRSYPHQLSGGMLQRAAIALAVAVSPTVVIADECTSALDVTTQIEVIDVLRTLVGERRGLIYVTHDLQLASELCTKLIVMYAGKVVETGVTGAVLASPRHPYTRALLAAVPTWGPRRSLRGIDGLPPHVTPDWDGCVFAPRCPEVMPACNTGGIAWVGSEAAGARCLRAT
jgi:oligopeptide/dipeptide ABC transporter ATP-binding protein